MNKNTIKNFALNARITLINSIKKRASEYGITENSNFYHFIFTPQKQLSCTEIQHLNQLIENIQKYGYEKTIDEAAFIWFSRFISLRYMEVNGYLPLNVRIFSNNTGSFSPEILSEAMNIELNGLDHNHVSKLLDKQCDNELYTYLLITLCNALSNWLPDMFKQSDCWATLLLPDNILNSDSLIAHMVEDIPEDEWKEHVQIIGWLYQYYNSETKDKVFADLKKNIKISPENIPAATQLFTPEWIVRYMVENSLGRLWHESHDDFNTSGWKYYVKDAESEKNKKNNPEQIRQKNRNIQPEQIMFMDPCMGSGHILVYAFDILMQIYISCGWSEEDAAKSILANNLYGLDIDKRAYQLAYFAVMMKARKYNNRILCDRCTPNLATFADITNFKKSDLSKPLEKLAKQFENADIYGSLLEIHEVEELDCSIDDHIISSENIEMMLRIYHILSQKYDVVCTNPPYMGMSGMNSTLSTFVKKYYFDYKSDLFSAFIVRCTQLSRPEGYLGFLTPYVWMFIQSYEKLRQYIYSSKTIESLIQFEYSSFEEATVPICAFVLKNSKLNKKGCYFRLTDFRGGMDIQQKRFLEAIAEHNCGFYYEADSDNFSKIPGKPVAYWITENFIKVFKNPKLEDFAYSFQGMITGDNNYFLRLWHENNSKNFVLNLTKQNADKFNNIWVPYNKGGGYRKWYGNNEYTLRWIDNGKAMTRARTENKEYYFREGVTWSFITSGKFSCRCFNNGFLWDVAGSSIFSVSDFSMYYICAFMNSKVVQNIFEITNPTINYQVQNIISLPIVNNSSYNAKIDMLAAENVQICKKDWDLFESSWDFKRHPLIPSTKDIYSKKAIYLEDIFKNWNDECNIRFKKLKSNEEELNRIFIDIYGLQDELTPEIEEKDVSVRKADLQRDIKSLISYAVGCLFGRYSIDCDGLCFAGDKWDTSKYQTIIPSNDNILQICDDNSTDDDLTTKIIEFIRLVYGDETHEKNMKFIADALGGKGTPKEVLKNYLLTGFFTNHCKIYQKHPIYWLFSSGKKNGFKALVYMHRWKSDIIATINTDYVHKTRKTYLKQLSESEKQLKSADSVMLKKYQRKLSAKLEEINGYEKKLNRLADMMIDIDLNDGVRVNYAKFSDVLEKIK